MCPKWDRTLKGWSILFDRKFAKKRSDVIYPPLMDHQKDDEKPPQKKEQDGHGLSDVRLDFWT